MRRHVPRIGDADRSECPLAALARHHEREDVRQLGLIREREQIGHQRGVRFERIGDAERLLERDVSALLRLVALNAPLDLTHVLQVGVHTCAVVRAEPRLQRVACR